MVSKKAGFTMIELLIVMVIMGILAAVGLRTFSSSQMKARDSQRKSDLRSISTALDLFYNDHGYYPEDDGLGGFVACGDSSDLEACKPGQLWTVDGSTYMVQIPADPSGGVYFYQADGANSRYFRLYARLENIYDRDVPKDDDGEPTYYVIPGLSGCGFGTCNYGRSSTNVDLGDLESYGHLDPPDV
jgi:general secretion pathway protein G